MGNIGTTQENSGEERYKSRDDQACMQWIVWHGLNLWNCSAAAACVPLIWGKNQRRCLRLKPLNRKIKHEKQTFDHVRPCLCGSQMS
jgi:hypothetical protein